MELDGRRDELRSRLKGLKIGENLTPSNALMEEHGRQFDADQLVYVTWAASTKRRPELLGEVGKKRPSTGFEEDSRGYIRRTETPVPDAADTSSDLLLQETLTRRSLSADAMNIMTHEGCGDAIVERLMEEHRAEAVTPQHAAVSLTQLQRADEHIWTRLSELAAAAGGIRPRPDGAKPLDGLVAKVLHRPRCKMSPEFLFPRRRPERPWATPSRGDRAWPARARPAADGRPAGGRPRRCARRPMKSKGKFRSQVARCKVLAEPKLAIILQPLLKAGQRSEQQPKQKQPPGDAPEQPSKKSKRRAAKKEKAEAAAKQALAQARAETAKAKQAAAKAQGSGGKAAGKQVRSQTGPSMPAELIGKARIDASGRRMCYGFNMTSGCTKAQPGQSCDRGFHGCMEPLPDGTACGKPHCLLNH